MDIMQFIRKHYDQDYKPNTRETIRRQTLQEFEQARIVDRNRVKVILNWKKHLKTVLQIKYIFLLF